MKENSLNKLINNSKLLSEVSGSRFASSPATVISSKADEEAKPLRKGFSVSDRRKEVHSVSWDDEDSRYLSRASLVTPPTAGIEGRSFSSI